MTANVVSYKLCDKQFDCEHCEFDQVVRNDRHHDQVTLPKSETAEATDIIDRLLNGLMFEHLHKGSIYLPNNLVLDELADQTFRLSLSPLAGHFLDNVFSMVPCRQGDEIRKGQPCLTLSGPWGGLSLNSPIHFLYQDKSDDIIQRNQTRWVVGIIQTEKNEIARERLSPQEWQQQIISITRKLVHYKNRYPDMETTIRAEVSKLKYLYQRIGKENYLNLLHLLFKQKIKTRSV